MATRKRLHQAMALLDSDSAFARVYLQETTEIDSSIPYTWLG